MKVYPLNANLTSNWLKVDFGNDFEDKTQIRGLMYFPIDDAREIVDNGCCVILGKKDEEECEGMRCYTTTRNRKRNPDNFIRYKLDCNEFRDFYVPKDLEGEILEIDLSRIGQS